MTPSERRLALYQRALAQPELLMNLDAYVSDCGSIFCLGGLAASFQPFIEEGLSSTPHGVPVFEENGYGLESLAVFFGTDENYFVRRMNSEAHLTHKEAALARLRRMLVEEGDITQEMADEMAARELVGA